MAGKPSRNITRKVLLGLVIIGFLMRLSAERRPEAPAVAADCATPSFTLSTPTVPQAGPVAFTIVGPEGRRYVLGFDTKTFTPRPDGGWDPVPLPGRADSVLVAAEPGDLPGCRREGYFATPVPLGSHTVTLYELTDRGVLFVAQQELEVVER